jgi:hypothetical protein
MIAETVVNIELGGKEYKLYFNANTMVRFEEVTGKNFLGTVAALYAAYKPMLEGKPDAAMASIELIRHVPMTELTALVWAGLHEYDANDEPTWPLTLAQVRRMIDLAAIPRLFLSFLRGQAANSPTQQELGESQAPSETEKAATAATAPKKPNGAAGGGERSTALPEDAFS